MSGIRWRELFWAMSSPVGLAGLHPVQAVAQASVATVEPFRELYPLGRRSLLRSSADPASPGHRAQQIPSHPRILAPLDHTDRPA
jgi:hypothetical protein